MLFFLKTTSLFKNKETYQSANQENGLSYNNITIKDLVNKDTDGDGILDWEEGLWGTDPTKKETTPGTLDSVAVEKLKATQANNTEKVEGSSNGSTENLTQTDKFSRELFATIVAANQNGVMDQNAIDALSAALAEQIKNPVPRKIYKISNINTIDSDTKQAIQKYSDTINGIYIKYKVQKGVMTILEELISDEENLSILSQLDPIINQINKIISELVKMEVPQSLSLLHLNLINSSQRMLENISDMQLLGSDSVVTMGAIIQYGENTAAVESSANRLTETIRQKLNN